MDDGTVERAQRSGWKLVAFALVGIGVAVGSGWGVVQVVDALESQGCGPYGGGYCDPAPRITVEPSTDLVDGQSVTVNGRGFLPSTSFGAAQCDPSVPGIDGCDLGNVELTTTNESGHVRLSMRVRRIITVQNRRVDCALSACTLGAATLEGTTPIEAVSAPISFDPAVPPIKALRVSVTVDKATTNGLRGTITCSRGARASVDFSIEQHLNGRSAFAYGYSEGPIPCGPTPRAWTVGFAEGSDRLTAGPASYWLFASASDELDSASAELSGPIRVVRVPPGDTGEAIAHA